MPQIKVYSVPKQKKKGLKNSNLQLDTLQCRIEKVGEVVKANSHKRDYLQMSNNQTDTDLWKTTEAKENGMIPSQY